MDSARPSNGPMAANVQDIEFVPCVSCALIEAEYLCGLVILVSQRDRAAGPGETAGEFAGERLVRIPLDDLQTAERPTA